MNRQLAFCLALYFSVLGICSYSIADSAHLSKQEALELLKQNGYRWKQSELLEPEAAAKTQQAGSALGPHVKAAARTFFGRVNAAEYGLPEPSIPDYFFFSSIELQANYPLYDAAALARLHAAHKNEGLNHETSLQYKADLTYMMLLEYLNVQRLKRQLEAHNANIQHSEEILKFATMKQKIGAGIPLDIARAKTLVEMENLKKITTYTKYMKARQDLALMLGRERLDRELEPLTLTLLPEDQLNAGLKESFENRADLKSVRYAIEASHLLSDAAHRETWPKLEGFGQAGFATTNAFDIAARIPTSLVGVQLSMPLWEAGYISAKQQEANVQVTKAELQQKQLQLEILSQMKEALGQLMSTREAVKISKDVVQTAKEEADIAEKRFYSGVTNAIEYSTSHYNYINAVDSNLDAILAYEVAKVNYYKVTGSFEDYFARDKRGL